MNLGHLSRALAIARALEERGHEVGFAAGGAPLVRLRTTGAMALEVPVIRQVVVRNRLCALASVQCNLSSLARRRSIVRALAGRIGAWAPDLVVSDYEPFTARAAERLGLPVVCLDHQQAVTALAVEVPVRYGFEAALTAAVIGRTVARHPRQRVVTSFFEAPVRDPARTTLVGPILRAEVLAARAEQRDHVLVYVNQGDGAALLDVLVRTGERFVVYGGELAADACSCGGRIAVPKSTAGFLEHLATAKAVICTAGHTLMSEALHLGKRVLALPIAGTFEQTLNALELVRAGLGEAVLGRAPTAQDVRGFLKRSTDGPRAATGSPGNEAALAILESALSPRRAPCAGAAA